MRKCKYLFKLLMTVALIEVMGLNACAPDVSCPTGHQDAKKLFAGAENGQGTEKARTSNGLIKKSKASKRKKKY